MHANVLHTGVLGSALVLFLSACAAAPVWVEPEKYAPGNAARLLGGGGKWGDKIERCSLYDVTVCVINVTFIPPALGATPDACQTEVSPVVLLERGATAIRWVLTSPDTRYTATFRPADSGPYKGIRVLDVADYSASGNTDIWQPALTIDPIGDIKEIVWNLPPSSTTGQKRVDKISAYEIYVKYRKEEGQEINCLLKDPIIMNNG